MSSEIVQNALELRSGDMRLTFGQNVSGDIERICCDTEFQMRCITLVVIRQKTDKTGCSAESHGQDARSHGIESTGVTDLFLGIYFS